MEGNDQWTIVVRGWVWFEARERLRYVEYVSTWARGSNRWHPRLRVRVSFGVRLYACMLYT